MPRKRQDTNGYDKPLPTRLRACFREAKTKDKITQDTLADILGVSRQALSAYLNGGSVPDAESLAKMARYFDVSTDYLLGLSDFKSVNKDMQNAFLCTGLNEEAIQSLFLMIQNDKADIMMPYTTEADYYADSKLITRHSILNIILSNQHFYEITRALEYSRIYGGVCEVHGELQGFGTADDVSISRMHKMAVYPAFAELINDFDNAVYEAEAETE